ncbi:biliverdin-producing heme oxygenase [Streptomyces sp. NPDC088194]|uniref:biliverdin-producing heme oxygenase n=1 Tax=Streptomyces sp. NPDC088194 TaxID=3154931 RepID=UPI0034504EED
MEPNSVPKGTERSALLSGLMRVAMRAEHDKTRQSPFMDDLLGGRLEAEAFTALSRQLWFVYRELEAAAQSLSDHPLVGPLVDPGLSRVAALERDLAHLDGPQWRRTLVPVPATRVYCARIAEVTRSWPAGYVAHHYTRYMGDLAGGQIVRNLAATAWGHTHEGALFYHFDHIPDPRAYRRRYRAVLDELPVAGDEPPRIAREVTHAFHLNNAMFVDLAADHVRAEPADR